MGGSTGETQMQVRQGSLLGQQQPLTSGVGLLGLRSFRLTR